MNWDVFITCAITGSGDTTSKSDKVPVTAKLSRIWTMTAAGHLNLQASGHARKPTTRY